MDGSSFHRFENRAAIPAAAQLPPSLYRCRLKRVFDVIVVGLALPFLLPVMIVLALLVRTDGGPPFYSQIRVGAAGKPFRIWKFRAMVANADEAVADHLQACPAAHAEWTAWQKLRNDPRITRVGLVLRRTSLDELPQIWNVLKGDMSLVGPRPMMPQQTALYPGSAYYLVRPGLTGLWQVSARNSTSFAQRSEFDSAYVESLSFTQDCSLILKTIIVVIRATGR